MAKLANKMFITSRLGRLSAVFVLMAAGGFCVYGGDVVGKLTVGYQGWFACKGDNSPKNVWKHWSTDGNVAPKPGYTRFELYPDVRDYPDSALYQTGYANLGNGSKSKLFSSYDSAVVNKHLEWMRDYGIDTVAVQRFGCDFDDSKVIDHSNGILTKVKNASVTYGRKFYVMYDITEWSSFQSQIKTDWNDRIVGSLQLTNSSAYAKEGGKPVVCIWGVGKEIGNSTSWTDVINFFKGKNCYVIIGVPRKWRDDDTSSSYQYAHMISPWTIGAYETDSQIDSHGTRMKNDKALCDSRGQAYQPVVWPGFAWSNWKSGEDQNAIPRRHGDFMWRQFYQVRSNNIPSVYVAMFDEYDEATAIAKAAEDSSMKPSNQYFLTLNADGTKCSSDFYLRLTGDGAKMVKKITNMVRAHPTPHVGGTPPPPPPPPPPASCHIDVPTGNVTVSPGGSLLVKVSASDPDGVERVKLFNGATELMSDSSAPYELTLTNLTASFTLTAKVKDVLGNYTDSDNSRIITVSGGPATTVTFYSVGVHDGYVDESSETSNVGGTNVATLTTGTALRVGDTGARKQRKSIVSFDTSTLPDAAVVTAATLKLKRGGGIGTPTSLGSLTVDIKNVSAGFGTSLNLENIDFEAAASSSNVGTLNYPAATNAWATAPLNANGISGINKTGHTQLRVRFATDDDNDTADDYLGFYSGENASSTNRPILEVTYQ